MHAAARALAGATYPSGAAAIAAALKGTPDALPESCANFGPGGGRLPEAWVVAQVRAAGFSLAGTSEVNANPKDTKDYAKGVWTLPPEFALGEKDHDRYAAIGESDRMTLKFVKPR
ncbi:MAG TPA: hypothetical protein VIY73_26280 [Polyangiaceae bacterium]